MRACVRSSSLVLLFTLPQADALTITATATQVFKPNLKGLDVVGEDAKWALQRYKQCSIAGILAADQDSVLPAIKTTFCQSADTLSEGKQKLLFLHGADSNALEWRHIMRRFGDEYDCVALDWWSGGFTEREPITKVLEKQPTPPQPWTLVRAHIRAFWESVLGAEPVILVGTSLGGAVALDFAVMCPEAVSKLILVDAGGQSYKSPPPDTVTALAPVVLGVKQIAAWVQARVPDEGVRLVALHRDQPGWLEGGRQYLRSGSYQRAVGPDLIRRVPQKTLVVWGEKDDILPVADAIAFERDLPDCDAVEIVEGSGHSPHLDNPDAVNEILSAWLA